MKNPHVVMTLIFSVALVISAAFLGLGLASLGRGIQTAGDSMSRGLLSTHAISFSNELKLNHGQIEISNGGAGGGEPLKILSSQK